MNRKLKALGLAFVASLATSAVFASGAQAIEFHAGEAHTALNGAQIVPHVFSVGPGFANVTCATAGIAGTTTKTKETEWTVTPTYAGCKDAFGRTAHVAMNKCLYRLHPTAEVSANIFSGNVDIRCESEKAIVITLTPGGLLGECKVTIPAQEDIGPVQFHNVANDDVKVEANATKIVTVTAGGLFNCGIGNGEHTEGAYAGESVVAGTTTAGSPLNIFVG